MDEDSGIGLPPSIASAWGVQTRPGKGPKPGLSLDRIVAAAIGVAGADGLAAVSMSRVAAELGAATMSLYRYVGSKDELLALMVDAALGAHPAQPDEGWRAGLSHWGWVLLTAYRRHPWAVRVPITGPPITPNQVDWVEHALRALRGTGLGEEEKMSVIMLIGGYVRNQASLVVELDAAYLAADSTAQEAMASYGRLMRKLIDPARFPEFSAVIAATVFDKADDPDDEFGFGLERILDGIEALVRERAGQSPTPTSS
jgi:AcrR family transcriptional regulator